MVGTPSDDFNPIEALVVVGVLAVVFLVGRFVLPLVQRFGRRK